MKKNNFIYHVLLFTIVFFHIHSGRLYASAGANLNQARNGTDSIPVNPVNFVNGNAGSGTAHFLEGMSIAYQCYMTSLPVGTQVTITFGYDIRNGSKNAFDYLTHYNRMIPHAFNLHGTAETINPLQGTVLAGGTSYVTYPIPAPSSFGSTVPGMPAASFNALDPGERVMTLYNGTIDTIFYATQGNLTANNSETRITVKFTPSNAAAVLTWGGHIGSRRDWGYTNGVPNSAGGISGSPFHMRTVSWSLGNIGNQDRSVSGAIVGAPYSPLPVDLVYFTAHENGNSNQVEWGTASEINNDYFTVDRSPDGINFTTVGRVLGAGNSTSSQNYAFTDAGAPDGICYYRLLQTDFDGTQSKYGPICVRNNHSVQSLSTIKVHQYPSGNYYVSFYTSGKSEVTLEITNTEGKLVHSERMKSVAGANFHEISKDLLPSKGLYFIRLSDIETQSPARMIVKS